MNNDANDTNDGSSVNNKKDSTTTSSNEPERICRSSSSIEKSPAADVTTTNTTTATPNTTCEQQQQESESEHHEYFLFRPLDSTRADTNDDDDDRLLFRTHDDQQPSLFKASLMSSTWLALLTYWASFQVAFVHLITFETLIVSLISAVSVVCYSLVVPPSNNNNDESNDEPLVAKLSLSFMSFIVVFPITANIGYAFRRREQALQHMAAIKSHVFNIYIAHRDWAFDVAKTRHCQHYSARNILHVQLNHNKSTTTTKEKGTKEKKDDDSSSSCSSDNWNVWGGAVSQRHVDEVRHVLVQMIRAMRNYLALPLASRNRHYYTTTGRQVRARVEEVQRTCLEKFYAEFQRLSLAVERMKEAGMPGNEAARINQYHSLFLKEWEMIRFIKSYRTPTGLRAFARIYILLHPLFVGPYYSWVAGAGRDEAVDDWPFQTSLAFAIALAIFTAVAMQGLFNVEVGLEDPFDESEGLDNLRVGTIFLEMERLLCMEWATEGWNDAVVRGKALYDIPFQQDYGCTPKDIPTPGLAEAMESLERDSNPLACGCLPRKRRARSRVPSSSIATD